MIDGVIIKDLQTHSDGRGFFREIMRETDAVYKDPGFGQLSHSLVNENVIKAWHFHHYQHQWNYAASGRIHVALYDKRENSSTYQELMEFENGDSNKPQLYYFPPGVLHGYKCLNGPANMLYLTSGTYDPENDEGRLAEDDPTIGFDWGRI